MGHVSVDDHRRSTGMIYGLIVDRMEHSPGLRDTTHGIGGAGSAAATVFWRYEMQPEESFDMHGMYPYATLFDCVEGGNFAGSGGPVPSFPNHLRHFVAWNFDQRRAPVRFVNHKNGYDFWGGRPSLVMPILVGMHGQLSPVNEKTVAVYESPGRRGRAAIALRGAARVAERRKVPGLGRRGEGALAADEQGPARLPARRRQHALGGEEAAADDRPDPSHADGQGQVRQDRSQGRDRAAMADQRRQAVGGGGVPLN